MTRAAQQQKMQSFQQGLFYITTPGGISLPDEDLVPVQMDMDVGTDIFGG